MQTELHPYVREQKAHDERIKAARQIFEKALSACMPGVSEHRILEIAIKCCRVWQLVTPLPQTALCKRLAAFIESQYPRRPHHVAQEWIARV